MGWLIYPLYDYIIMQNYKEISYAVCWDKLTLLIWLENKWKSIETNKLTWVNKTTLITGCRWFGGSPNCVLLFTAQKRPSSDIWAVDEWNLWSPCTGNEQGGGMERKALTEGSWLLKCMFSLYWDSWCVGIAWDWSKLPCFLEIFFF